MIALLSKDWNFWVFGFQGLEAGAMDFPRIG